MVKWICTNSQNNDQRIGVERDKSLKSRSSALFTGTALVKILMLIGKFQAFRITCIMLILGKVNNKK
ncbi:hypothetical protein A9J31_13955 [Acinetobacter gandensis]|uniref:Uncharacterized protein n=1 Tax=Acinetobacter gandensis TaxID=1443941 RepID=A0A1A7RD27_9GAMM|nr:hypothetical protein A9J31_13955 [Acinetobacter gandensis]